MSEKILFGAEVNKIQSTLFAGGLQRQVVGGSRLLAVFSEEVKRIATKKFSANRVIISAGGKFRIVFTKAVDAESFGCYIADSYLVLLNGPMSVATPIPYDDTRSACGADNWQQGCRACFACVEQMLAEQLNKKKASYHDTVDASHSPTTAFCQSSGDGLASRYTSIIAGEEKLPTGQVDNPDWQYLSAETFVMKEVGYVTKKNRPSPVEEAPDNSFLGEIAHPLPLTHRKLPWAYQPEELAEFDPARRNVAYLVADGNNMGAYFSHCQSEEEAERLSQAVDNAVAQAITQALPQLKQRLEEAYGTFEYLPALPLIAAGDDIFVLLPAPYALDYARQFCLTFSEVIRENETIKRLVKKDNPRFKPPTMSAAVVFCKGNYPYNLAHERGEELLKQAKQVVKTTGRETGDWHSAVSFDVIVGSELVSGSRYSGDYRPGLGIYWAAQTPIFTRPNEITAALDLQRLLDQRYIMQRLPAKRRAELRDLFAEDQLPVKGEQARWDKQLQRLRQRIKVTYPHSNLLTIFDEALKTLGDATADEKANPGHWLFVKRGGDTYSSHGIPDLLQGWHYVQSLTYPLSAYQEERER